MVFDFAAQPPELISAKIYSGPGAESLQAAASAWDGLASELQSTAANYQSVISGLVSGDWTGPSSEAAAAAAAPYVSWLSTTAGQAEQTAGQARAAASAYETALAATVPPAEIVANRTQLLSLLQTNILGQNNASIAAARGRVRPVLGPGCRRHDRLRRIVASGHQWAGLVHRGAADHQRQRSDHSGGRNRRRPRRRRPLLWKRSSSRSRPTPATSSPKSAAFNTDYTKFFTSALGTLPGGSYLATTWTNLYSLISGVGSQATWTNVVNSTTGLGISQWKNFFIYQPWSHGVGWVR